MSEPDLPELDRWLYVGTTLIKVTPGSTGPDVFCKLLDAEAAIATERARADALRAELGESDAVRERLAELLKQTAVALRGEPPPLTSWSWHDVPERAAAAIAAIDVMQRAASINAERADALEAALHRIANAHIPDMPSAWNDEAGWNARQFDNLRAIARDAARALLEKT